MRNSARGARFRVCSGLPASSFRGHRLTLWIIAVLIDCGAPYLGFRGPRYGATSMESWPLAGLHLLERTQQNFINSIGKSILLLGATLVYGTNLMAAALGLGIIVTLWWLYFVYTTNTGEHAFEQDGDHTKLARSGLAYAHGIMVAGVIIFAVANEEIIAHPGDPARVPTILVAILGPSIFLGELAPVVWGVHATHASGLLPSAGVILVMIALTVVASRSNPS